jgi:hypothetical protein
MKLGNLNIVDFKLGNTQVNSIYLGNNLVWSSIDADAAAFLTAAGITDATITSAINKLVVDLKSAAIWSKMKAIYPFVGGTAFTTKFNLKDPRDLDAAFRLIFFGGLVFSNTGINSNGTNGYYTTKFNDSVHGSLNNQSMGVYLRTNLNGGGPSMDIGTEISIAPYIQIYAKAEASGQQFASRHHSGTATLIANSDSRGLFAISRLNSANYLMQKNSTFTTISIGSSGMNNSEILGFKNQNAYTAREHAFSFIGDGLSSTEMNSLYTAVQSFQTTLNRQV